MIKPGSSPALKAAREIMKTDMPTAPPQNAAECVFHSRPLVPQFHLFDALSGPHILLSEGSRIYGLAPEIHRKLASMALESDLDGIESVLQSLQLDRLDAGLEKPASDMPIQALSLAIAQKCNLGCSYCYAQQGDFGEKARNMPLETAILAVDLLLEQHARGTRVNLSFLGGEPLVNRPVLQEVTRYAAAKAERMGVDLGFSVTSNGTLLTPEDAAFFESFGFAVTISLDGIGAVHDGLRPDKGGKPTYHKIMEHIHPMLQIQRKMQVSARVTVTPRNLDLVGTLEEFIKLGFHSVGFSPMISAPGGQLEMDPGSLVIMLDQMIACGRAFVAHTLRRERYPFANMVNALREIHRGTSRPYPCGAGAAYLGVSAGGELAACHRFVSDPTGALGDLKSGPDLAARNKWLSDRHVLKQEPCRSCWARFLCGGGCHHEVIHRGRPACDYIRGWLHFCLQVYPQILESRPDFFSA